MEYSIVIPVFNSERSLPELGNRIMAVFKNISEKYEIIFVDDFSQDNSWKVLVDIKHENPDRIRLFRLGKVFRKFRMGGRRYLLVGSKSRGALGATC